MFGVAFRLKGGSALVWHRLALLGYVPTFHPQRPPWLLRLCGLSGLSGLVRYVGGINTGCSDALNPLYFTIVPFVFYSCSDCSVWCVMSVLLTPGVTTHRILRSARY